MHPPKFPVLPRRVQSGWQTADVDLWHLREAKKATEDKVKELHKGQQSSALTAKQAQDVLTVRDMHAAYRQETGKVVSIVEMTGNYLSAVKQLPKGCSLTEAVRVYRQSIAAVQRKPLAEAVVEFCDARRPKGVSQEGKRSVLSPVYVWPQGCRSFPSTPRRRNSSVTMITPANNGFRPNRPTP